MKTLVGIVGVPDDIRTEHLAYSGHYWGDCIAIAGPPIHYYSSEYNYPHWQKDMNSSTTTQISL